MQNKSIIETIIPELIFSILIQAGAPYYFGRLEQLSKTMKSKLQKADLLNQYWESLYRNHFNAKYKLSAGETYREKYEENLTDFKEKYAHLTHQHKLLLAWITYDDFETFQNYNWEDSYLFFSHMEKDICPITYASLKNKQRFLNYFYQHAKSHIFLNNENEDKNKISQAYWAVACGQSIEIELLIPKIIAKGEHIALLQVATKNGHLSMVEFLLNLGANPNCLFPDNLTPLYTASFYGHSNIVKLLIERKAEVNYLLQNNETALSCAVNEGHPEVVKILLNAGAKVNLKLTLLYTAAQNDNFEIVQLLLAAKPDVNFPWHGKTPLFISCDLGHLKIANELLLAGADKEATNDNGVTPLEIAIKNGNLEIVRSLLENGVNFNRTNHSGTTPLMLAEKNDKKEIFLLLKMWQIKESGGTTKEKILQILQLGNFAISNNIFHSSPYNDFVREVQKYKEEMSSFDLLVKVNDRKDIIPKQTYIFIGLYVAKQIMIEELQRRASIELDEPPVKKVKLS